MTETVQSLKAIAVAKTGLSDFGDDWFEVPLSVWLEDLSGPWLNERGRGFMARLAVTNLCRRLEILECLKRHPQIDDVVVPPILYITGLERSGTTLLHNLLALHPKSRALLRWELMRPTPPPEAATFRSDPRIAKVQASIDPLRGSQLEVMHWVNANEPEECTWGAYDCTGLLGRAVTGLMPQWQKWPWQNDMRPSFREHRRLIKLLTWLNPGPQGGHLVLKCPQNSRSIAQLAEVFPEARFVFTHRDPYRVAVSVCAMVDGITAPFANARDAFVPGGRGIGEVIQAVEIGLSRMIAFTDAHGHKVADISYPALVRDPVGVVRDIYARFGLEWPPEMNGRITSFLAAQAAGKRATPPRELPDHGITRDILLQNDSVARYCKRFNIQPETTRLTGT